MPLKLTAAVEADGSVEVGGPIEENGPIEVEVIDGSSSDESVGVDFEVPVDLIDDLPVEESTDVIENVDGPSSETPVVEVGTGDEVSVENPVDQSPASETPADDSPANETSSEEASSAETPANEIPITSENPLVVNPIDDADSAEDSIIEETPRTEELAPESEADPSELVGSDTIADPAEEELAECRFRHSVDGVFAELGDSFESEFAEFRGRRFDRLGSFDFGDFRHLRRIFS